MRRIILVPDAWPGTPGLDTGVSHAVALAVGAGDLGETLRIHTSSDVVAFGRRDTVESGYPEAVRAARRAGFEAVERLAGGRAAVFTTNTLAFSWAIPTPDPRVGVQQRFDELAGIVRDALGGLGVDARVGEVPGEYCPGSHSVNAGGVVKLMGVGQRLVRGAAHVGGVVVVDDAARVRDVLLPVYRALGIAWDPATVGAVADHSPGVDNDSVGRAITEEFARRYHVETGSLPVSVVDHGRALAAGHVAVSPPST